MIKLNGIEATVDSYRKRDENGTKEGVEIILVYNKITATETLDYVLAQKTAKELSKDDPLRKGIEEALKKLG